MLYNQFQVYLDFGLAVPKLSVHGMISSVKELLELAPLKKVMHIHLKLNLYLIFSYSFRVFLKSILIMLFLSSYVMLLLFC